MKNILLLSLFTAFGLISLSSQSLSAKDIIDKSIEFHDPKGKWKSFQETLDLRQENPKNKARYRKVYLDLKEGSFTFESEYPEGKLQYYVKNNEGKALWNNSEQIVDSISTKYRVSPERALMYRDYYAYLYGMPMKLYDPGTNIHPEVEEVKFYGKDYYKITATYDESVGSDNWHFYFDKHTFALGAYEFWKKEPGDGEYLLLNGIKDIGKVRLPEKIAWYMSNDDRWLGTDILE